MRRTGLFRTARAAGLAGFALLAIGLSTTAVTAIPAVATGQAPNGVTLIEA